MIRAPGLLLATVATAAIVSAAPRHVIVLGFDGMSPDGVRTAATPNFDRLCREGACTLAARGVIPTVSSPNWASMIMGAGPEQHGITSNEWRPDKFEIAPVAQGPGGFFPTMFSVVRGQRKGAVIGVFHEWAGFGRLVEPGVPDVIENPKGHEATMARAVAFLRERRPTLLFIHIDYCDHVGHEKGHGTAEYYASVAEADRLTGVLVAAIEGAGMRRETALIVTADHGGVGKKHGGNTMAELEIPWMAWGSGVVAGRAIRGPVNTYDTAATVVDWLGLRAPANWLGRPVL